MLFYNSLSGYDIYFENINQLIISCNNILFVWLSNILTNEKFYWFEARHAAAFE